MRETASLGAIGVAGSWGGAAIGVFAQVTPLVSFLGAILGLIIAVWTLYRMAKYPPAK